MIYLYYTKNVNKEDFDILTKNQHLMLGLIKMGNEYQSSPRLLNGLMDVFDYRKSRKAMVEFVNELLYKFDEHLSLREIITFSDMGFDIFIPHNFNITSPLYMILNQFIGVLKAAEISSYVLCDFKGDLTCLA